MEFDLSGTIKLLKHSSADYTSPKDSKQRRILDNMLWVMLSADVFTSDRPNLQESKAERKELRMSKVWAKPGRKTARRKDRKKGCKNYRKESSVLPYMIYWRLQTIMNHSRFGQWWCNPTSSNFFWEEIIHWWIKRFPTFIHISYSVIATVARPTSSEHSWHAFGQNRFPSPTYRHNFLQRIIYI